MSRITKCSECPIGAHDGCSNGRKFQEDNFEWCPIRRRREVYPEWVIRMVEVYDA